VRQRGSFILNLGSLKSEKPKQNNTHGTEGGLHDGVRNFNFKMNNSVDHHHLPCANREMRKCHNGLIQEPNDLIDLVTTG